MNILKLVLTLVVTLCVTPKAEAAFLDLSAVNASGTINGANFSRTVLGGQGTGVLDPFLRLHDNGIESGYNTNGALEFDTMPSPHTHAILLSDIPLKNISGTNYREILLDAGEPGGNNILLTNLELYLLNGPNISGYPANFPIGNRAYNMLDGNYNSLKLDNVIGNGVADMFFYVPDSNFANLVGNNPYLYLYSRFTDAGGTFEEWGVQGQGGGTTSVVPEPATLALFATGLFGLLRSRRKIA